MKRFIPAAVIVVGALAVASVAAVSLNGADASDDMPAAVPQNQQLPHPAVTGASTQVLSSANADSQTRQKGAYVGIALAALTEDEPDALGIEEGAVVRSVLRDSPAEGLLEEEDVITSVDGEPVSGPKDVVDAVKSSSPDEVMTFTVLRDGDTMNVEVTLGEREAGVFAFSRYDVSLGHGLSGRFHGLKDRVVRSEFVTETDDGFQTTRTIVGTVENVDVEAGTFDLSPVDGSDTVHFEIDDQTRVVINHEGDISGLNPGERTLVVEVETADGGRIVKLVSQGEGIGHTGPRRYFGDGMFGRPGLRFRGSRDGQSFVEVLPGHIPEIRERLRSFLPDDALEDLKKRGFELERFFDRIPEGLDHRQ